MNVLVVTAMQIIGARKWAPPKEESPRHGRPTNQDPLTRADIIAVLPPDGAWMTERDVCKAVGLELTNRNVDRIRSITRWAVHMGLMRRRRGDQTTPSAVRLI